MIVFLVLATSVLSCVREKETACGSVKITAEWGALTKSQGMSIIFYPKDGSPLIRQEIAPEGFSCTLPEGKYSVLFFNNNTKNIRFNHIDNYDQAEATVLPSSRAEQSISQPDMLYGNTIDEITVEKDGIVENNVHISTYTKNIVANINLTEEGGKKIKNISAQLKGVSHSINLSKKRPVYESTATNTDMNTEIQSDGNISLNCTTFGVPHAEDIQGEEVKTTVEIAAIYTDNTTKTVTADISKVIHAIQDLEEEEQVIIQLRHMGVEAVVVSWKIGNASGSIGK